MLETRNPSLKKKGVFHAELNHHYKIFPIISLYIISLFIKIKHIVPIKINRG